MTTESIIVIRESDLKTRPAKSRVAFFNSNARGLMAGVLGIADLMGLGVAIVIALLFRKIPHMIDHGAYYAYLELYLSLALVLAISFFRKGLYPGLGMGYIEELRHIVTSICFTFLIIAGATFALKTSLIYSRLVLLMTWGLSMVFIPWSRYLVRKTCMRMRLWGEPVAIIGDLDKAMPLAGYFKRAPQFGIRPLVVMRDEYCSAEGFKSYPVLPIARIKDFARSLSLRTVLIVVNDLNHVDGVVGRYRYVFERVILIKYQNGRYGLNNLDALDFADVLGLQVRHNLLNFWSQVLKRSVEIVLTSIGLFFLAPFLGLMMLAIRLDSPGGVFYRQARLGREGNVFKLLKFRTMYSDADEVLQEQLAHNPELKKEWDQYQKLRNDPRITRVGRFLRKFSLDELPQLWNVLTGEMSLVGPRPIMVNQRGLYGEIFDDYVQVAPGITGLWQISGRNHTTFDRRAELDEEYIQRWSLWLDLFIMLKTVKVVLMRDGAF